MERERIALGLGHVARSAVIPLGPLNRIRVYALGLDDEGSGVPGRRLGDGGDHGRLVGLRLGRLAAHARIDDELVVHPPQPGPMLLHPLEVGQVHVRVHLAVLVFVELLALVPAHGLLRAVLANRIPAFAHVELRTWPRRSEGWCLGRVRRVAQLVLLVGPLDQLLSTPLCPSTWRDRASHILALWTISRGGIGTFIQIHGFLHHRRIKTNHQTSQPACTQDRDRMA